MSVKAYEIDSAVAESLPRLEGASAADVEGLLTIRDISRGYIDGRLIRTARILPAIQSRFGPDDLVAIEPLFRRALEIVGRWGIGKIGGQLLSAEDETAAILSGRERDRDAHGKAGTTSVHESLCAWLKTREPASDANTIWLEAWAAAESFSALKKPWLLDFLGNMEEHGLIGETVLDVGAGRVAVSDCLASGSRRVVQVDAAAKGTKDNVLLVELDIEEAISRERGLAEMRAYIERDTFDTVICSHILNYVDFRKTIAALHGIHSPGGRLVIFNQPFEGEAEYFSQQGVSDNVALLQFLAGEGYAIEYLQAAPWVHVNDYDADLRAKSLLAVARN